MKLKAAILDAMATDQLRQCSEDFDVEVADRRKREVLIASLRRKRSISKGELLEYLSEVEVKEVCEALEVDATGRRGALIQRLLAQFAVPEIGQEGGEAPANETGKLAARSEQMATRISLTPPRDDEVPVMLPPSDPTPAPAPAERRTQTESPILKITRDSAVAQSADIVSNNIEQLKDLFPGAFTEGHIDFEVLKQLLGGTVDEREEKYGLNWHGKRRARQLALTPSTGTLRPCPEDSLDWDTTQNLMIEGDNLEVLKLLQKSYAGKVKLIYIDPPYNTGKDFVYPDNFQDSIKNYLELTGQVEGGRNISSNTEASGRFHTDWLSMMYPRLLAARTLLKKDGFLFISCDDGEISNLKAMVCEIFGEENCMGIMVWHARGRSKTPLSIDHEYIVVVTRDANALKAIFDKSKKGDANWYGEPIARKYSNPDNDGRGVWRDAQHTVTEGKAHYTYSINRETGALVEDKVINDLTWYGHQFWMYPPATIKNLYVDKRLVFTDQGTRLSIKVKKFKSEEVPYTSLGGLIQRDEISSRHGTEELEPLMGARVFDYPKPTNLIRKLVRAATRNEDVVMDFFAGSGTTGHAVMLENAEDQGCRRFVLVQLPEPLDAANAGQKRAMDFCRKLKKPQTIVELTKERLRRAGKKVKVDTSVITNDCGFRVYKLDHSNIRAWQPSGNLEKDLVDNMEHIVPGRSEQDVLTELLLKLGLDLCVPIETRKIAGKSVHSIGGGVLLACLDTRISATDAEPLALGIADWHQEVAPVGDSTCVFRDSAFADDVAKTNLAAILQQHGITNVRSL